MDTTDEGARLARLAQELHDDWVKSADGQKPGSQPGSQPGRKSRAMPRRIGVDDAGAIARALHREMDAATAARDAYAAKQGLTIACQEGCHGCCENLIIAHQPEAIAVAQWLSEPANHAVRDRFLDAYHGWREALGDLGDRIQDALDRGDSERYEDLARQAWRRRVLCPFNHERRCTIYPVRPNVCREGHALNTHEHCTPDSEKRPSMIQFSPMNRFREKTRTLMTAAHVAVLGNPKGLSPLADAVVHLLRTGSARRGKQGGKVGRNAPCPCGSGKKHKRCCGA